MANELRANLDAKGKRVAIVASRFNESIVGRLVDGAVECFRSHGVRDRDVDVYWVAGAFELPQLATRLVRRRQADGIVCVGALIRGETYHFEVLSHTVTSALESVGTSGDIPVTFGVLTVDSMEQAVARAGGGKGNIGWNAALALVEMMGHWRGRD